MSKRRVRPMLDLDDEDARTTSTMDSRALNVVQRREPKKALVQLIRHELDGQVKTVTSKALVDKVTKIIEEADFIKLGLNVGSIEAHALHGGGVEQDEINLHQAGL